MKACTVAYKICQYLKNFLIIGHLANGIHRTNPIFIDVDSSLKFILQINEIVDFY